VIVDLQRFVAAERPHWDKLEQRIRKIEIQADRRMSLDEMEEFYLLYQRAGAALVKVRPLRSEDSLTRYLEWLVGRAYAEIHESRQSTGFRLRRLLMEAVPQAFRRRARYFKLSVAATLVGVAFGAGALALSRDAKDVLMPFSHLHQKPSERVAKEMEERGKDLEGKKGRFSAHLMTHNIQVTFFVLALGVSFGLGSIVVLFYNGVILGAVAFDYIGDGQGLFLAGWLLPHGSVEIPAILIGGQAALLLGHAMIGWGTPESRADRLRSIGPDLATLAAGAAALLVWAGIVESFFSQYHEPVLPYGVKIAFGSIQLALLFAYLYRGGRG
jgi:uncharacterized membrane protein SpoIIM required for sporulation